MDEIIEELKFILEIIVRDQQDRYRDFLIKNCIIPLLLIFFSSSINHTYLTGSKR